MASIFKRIDWKVFAILLAAGMLGVVAIIPYLLDLLEGRMIAPEAKTDIPLPIVVVLAIVQNGILLAVAIFIGMILSERVGLGMPLIRAWANGKRPQDLKDVVVRGTVVGAVVGGVMVAIEVLFFAKHLPASMLPVFDIPLWKRLAAGVLYGGLTEEIFMRLFLLSLVAWLLGKGWKTPQGLPTSGAFWAAIFVVAILFGLGHLPATSAIAPLTPLLVVRALVLNGVAGVAFGYLYWKRGLESAMVGHMSTHLVLQIPGVMLIRSLT